MKLWTDRNRRLNRWEKIRFRRLADGFCRLCVGEEADSNRAALLLLFQGERRPEPLKTEGEGRARPSRSRRHRRQRRPNDRTPSELDDSGRGDRKLLRKAKYDSRLSDRK